MPSHPGDGEDAAPCAASRRPHLEGANGEDLTEVADQSAECKMVCNVSISVLSIRGFSTTWLSLDARAR